MKGKQYEGLRRAVRELRYLLDCGYPRDSAVNFVSNRYRFPLEQRHLLTRCVFSRGEAAGNRRKAVAAGAVRGQRLGVDGYNVLISLESFLAGKMVIRCDDGYVRDLRAMFGKYRPGKSTPHAISFLIKTLTKGKPANVAVLFDGQVSRSGDLASKISGELKLAGLNGEAKAVRHVDATLREFDIVASSDRAVIKRARAVWDIPAEILKSKKGKLLDLRKF